MTLKNYILNGPSVVIEDDDRDPHVSWRNHLERTDGKRGGVDLVAKVGTPIYAPTDGVMDWRKNDGSAGNSCRFVHDDNKGWKDVFSHLSAYVGKDMQRFKQGELIAYSGNSGGVTPHLHRHLLDPNDVRQNPWDHFTPATTPAAETAKPLVTTTTIPTEIGTLMKPIIIFGPTTGTKFPYLYDPYTGERHFLQPVELSAIRESKQGIAEMTLGTQAEFDAIQKRPGTR